MSSELYILLLSLVLPSYIVAPNRELANTLFSFDISIISVSMAYNNKNKNIDIDTLRGRSVNTNTNGSRELSIYSSASFISYIERMEAQNNNPSWTNQVDEYNDLQGFSLSYTTSKIENNNTKNKATELENIPNLHEKDVNNTNTNTYIP